MSTILFILVLVYIVKNYLLFKAQFFLSKVLFCLHLTTFYTAVSTGNSEMLFFMFIVAVQQSNRFYYMKVIILF